VVLLLLWDSPSTMMSAADGWLRSRALSWKGLLEMGSNVPMNELMLRKLFYWITDPLEAKEKAWGKGLRS
jgi:hypothetical protein